MTTITAPAPTATRPQPRGFLAQLGVDSAYALVGLPLGVAGFALMITGLSVGAGLLVTVIGLPVLVATLFVARAFAHLERARIRPVVRRDLIAVTYRRPAPDARWWRRTLTPLADGQAWLDLVHAIVRFPVTVVAFVVTVVWWSLAAGGLTYWLWQRWLPADNQDDLPAVLGFGTGRAAHITAYTLIGVIAAVTLPFLVRLVALAEAWLAYGLLVGVASLRAEIRGLSAQARTAQAQTAYAVSAEATALRRLERDIHDGPQQRLVRLAVDLGRVRQQLDHDDPAAARATVEEALAQTRETLDELRTPVAWDRAAHPHRPGSGGRVGRAGRPGDRSDPPRRGGRPAPGRGGHRTDRVLHGGRSPDQPRQTQRRHRR